VELLSDVLRQEHNIEPLRSEGQEEQAYTWRNLGNKTLDILYNYLRDRGEKMLMDDYTKQLTEYLARWYCGDNQEVTDKIRIHKGWLIRGSVGVGKSKLLTSFCKAVNADFYDEIKRRQAPAIRLVHSFDVQTAYIEQNTATIEVLKSIDILVIDDVGVENSEVLYYGNRLCPFVDLYDKRYRSDLRTVLITNLLPKSDDDKEVTLRSKYGERIYDRIRECCNDFVFEGESKRK
jgi:DNA replication protein DnaC